MRGIFFSVLAAAVIGGVAPAAAYVDTMPGSSEFYLGADDVAALDCYDLWHARNEIYARNGYKFLTEAAKAEFGKDGWTRKPKLNDFEQTNIALIQKFEKIHHC